MWTRSPTGDKARYSKMGQQPESWDAAREGVPDRGWRTWGIRALAAALMMIGTIVGTAAVTSAQEVQPPPDHSDVQAELNFAGFRWASSQIDDYKISYSVICFCPAPRPVITVEVEDGIVVSATSSDGAPVLRPRTVPAMFDEIQAEIDRPAASVSATFDSRTGRPESFGFDIDERIADEEYSVVIREFVNNEFTDLQTELDIARDTWGSRAPATENYSLAYRVICFCPQGDMQRIEVRNGDVIERSEDPFFGPAKTVDELFDLIQDVIDDATGTARVEYDQRTGVPMVIALDPLPGAVDDETTYQVTSFEFVPNCCDPLPTLNVTATCLAENGRIDVSFVSTALADGPVEHALHIGGLAPRLHTVVSGETVTEVATGRPDGPLTVELWIGGVLITSETVLVDCDPERREVDVEVTCLNDDGRFDIWLTAPDQFPAPGTLAGAVIAVAAQPQPIPPPRFDYTVELTTATRPPIVRSAALEPTQTALVTITGRSDLNYDVTVLRNGEQIFNDTYTVSCDVFDEPVTLTVSCLADNGRFDVDLFNDGADPATYVVSVTPLATRVRRVDAGASVRVTYTGRPDLPSDITVDRDGIRIFRQTVTPDCDPDCPEGYQLDADGICLTPNANCAAPQLELETIGGVPFVDPITGEITAIITYSCVATCDAPAFPGGPGRCVLALP